MPFRRLAVWFGLVLALALYSRWYMDRTRTDRCSLDGNRIEPIYAVHLMLDGKVLARFCCIPCAREWPDVPSGAYWRVTDEITGEPLDATTASFVESSVVTVPSRQARIHVFAHWADAMEHDTRYSGVRIPNPLVIDPPTSPKEE